MVELTTLFGLTQTLAIIVGVIIALMELRHLRQTRNTELETRQAQLFWDFIDKITTKETFEYANILGRAKWSSYEEWLEMYRNDAEYRRAFVYFTDGYQGIGVAVKLGYVDIKLFAHYKPKTDLGWWERHKDVIYEERNRRNDRRYCGSWEYFYYELVKYFEEHPELAP